MGRNEMFLCFKNLEEKQNKSFTKEMERQLIAEAEEFHETQSDDGRYKIESETDSDDDNSKSAGEVHSQSVLDVCGLLNLSLQTFEYEAIKEFLLLRLQDSLKVLFCG